MNDNNFNKMLDKIDSHTLRDNEIQSQILQELSVIKTNNDHLTKQIDQLVVDIKDLKTQGTNFKIWQAKIYGGALVLSFAVSLIVKII